MPLPDAVARLVSTRRFWTDYFWITDAVGEAATDPYPELGDCELRFRVGPRHALVLRLDPWLSYISLDLSVAGGAPIELGFDDQAHWHPHVLRWEELDRICASIARDDPALPHPGVPLLLLFRFAPVVDEDDARRASSLLDAAWDRLGLFSARERLSPFDRVDLRGSNVRWVRKRGGHRVLEQAAGRQDRVLYSLRRREAAAFPHAEIDAMLAHTNVPETPPAVDPPPALRNLDVTLRISESLPANGGRFVTLFVDRALRHLGIGKAEVTGGTSRDGKHEEVHVLVRLRGEVSQHVGRLMALLAAVGVDSSVTARVPLPAAEEAFGYLQLANVELFRWSKGVRFDWRPLDAEQRRAISATLAELGARAPDPAGAQAVTVESQTVRVVFPDLSSDDQLDAGSLVFDELTPAVARVAHRLASVARLAIVPRLIAPTVQVFERLDVPWPGTALAEDPGALHALLRR